MKTRCFISIILNILPIFTFAGWPSFYVLQPDQVSNLIQRGNCPTGKGYIPAGTTIPIQSRYIPPDQQWYWVYTGDSSCQSLPDKLNYLDYQQTSNFYPGTIDTIYGTQTNNLFRFTFYIPDDHWNCGSFAGPIPPQVIGCAQDEAK